LWQTAYGTWKHVSCINLVYAFTCRFTVKSSYWQFSQVTCLLIADIDAVNFFTILLARVHSIVDFVEMMIELSAVAGTSLLPCGDSQYEYEISLACQGLPNDSSGLAPNTYAVVQCQNECGGKWISNGHTEIVEVHWLRQFVVTLYSFHGDTVVLIAFQNKHFNSTFSSFH